MCDVCVTHVVRVGGGGGGGGDPAGRKIRSYHTVPNFHNAYTFGGSVSEASRKHSTDR